MPTYPRPKSATLFRTRCDGWWRLAELLARGEQFSNTTGTLRGTHRTPSGGWPSALGRLEPAEAERFRRLLSGDGSRPAMDMIIYSYATPIAWHVPGTGWTVPDATYSATTSRHQSVVRVALANLPAIRRADLVA